MNDRFIIVGQFRKGDVRALIENSALRVFSSRGYDSASIAEIARDAGVSTGNVYVYFANKQALYRAVMDPSIGKELGKLLQRELSSFRKAPSEELVDFVVRNRLQVSIVLGGVTGNESESTLETVVHDLVRVTLRRTRRPMRTNAGSHLRFALEQLHSSFLRSLGTTLRTFRSRDDIRSVVAVCFIHHSAGLRELLDD